ncbi:MAG: hypothetical protein ACKVON_10145, partial [Beijerinckiaceae bacterium]
MALTLAETAAPKSPSGLLRRVRTLSRRTLGFSSDTLLAAAVVLLLVLPLFLVLVQAVLPGLFNLDGPDWTVSLAPLAELVTSPRLARGVLNATLL